MAVDLTTVITPDKVKDQLGVGDADISDTRLINTGIYDDLQLELYDWFPNYEGLILDVTPDPAIVAQKLAVQVYSKHFLCSRLAQSGDMSFYQSTGDGQNEDSRFSTDFSLLAQRFAVMADEAKAKALGITTQYTPESVSEVFVVFGISSPDEDVVDR